MNKVNSNSNFLLQFVKLFQLHLLIFLLLFLDFSLFSWPRRLKIALLVVAQVLHFVAPLYACEREAAKGRWEHADDGVGTECLEDIIPGVLEVEVEPDGPARLVTPELDLALTKKSEVPVPNVES